MVRLTAVGVSVSLDARLMPLLGLEPRPLLLISSKQVIINLFDLDQNTFRNEAAVLISFIDPGTSLGRVLFPQPNELQERENQLAVLRNHGPVSWTGFVELSCRRCAADQINLFS
ncbi:hypothetical protein XENORESO_013304, partial [Xenotaenia resolanae]